MKCLGVKPPGTTEKYYNFNHLLSVTLKKSGGKDNGPYLQLNTTASPLRVTLAGLDANLCRAPAGCKLTSLDSIASMYTLF